MELNNILSGPQPLPWLTEISWQPLRQGGGSDWLFRGQQVRGPGALCALGAGEEVSTPGRDLGADSGGQTQGISVSGWDQLLGEPWADNGLIKERVQAGRSWACPQRGGECGELSLLLLAQPMEQLSSGGRELESEPENDWTVALGQPKWSWPLCLA